MAGIGTLRQCVSPQGRGHWLTYLFPIGFYLFLALMGLHEGPANALVFLTLVAVCGLQLWRQTLLGWAIVFVPVAVYAALMLGQLAKLPPAELIVFSLPAAAAAVALWRGRPQATRVATGVAVAAVGIPLVAFLFLVFW